MLSSRGADNLRGLLSGGGDAGHGHGVTMNETLSNTITDNNTLAETKPFVIDTGHEDTIHDLQLNLLGTRMAACSSDKAIRVYDIKLNPERDEPEHQLVAKLEGHEGPVWQLGWAHPQFGTMLASCSYDRRVIIWKEVVDCKPDGKKGLKWEINFTYDGHESSVNSVCWAPPEWGLVLACGSSDGSITVLSFLNDRWDSKKIPTAHTLGCNAVTWAPATYDENEVPQKRFASGGNDNLVKIWREENEEWIEETKLEGHSDWVKDVAWSPLAGVTKMTIASCSQDKRVIIWSNRETDGIIWAPELLKVFDDVVYHVSWNEVGSILAVSGGDSEEETSLWCKSETEGWKLYVPINPSTLDPEQQN